MPSDIILNPSFLKLNKQELFKILFLWAFVPILVSVCRPCISSSRLKDECTDSMYSPEVARRVMFWSEKYSPKCSKMMCCFNVQGSLTSRNRAINLNLYSSMYSAKFPSSSLATLTLYNSLSDLKYLVTALATMASTGWSLDSRSINNSSVSNFLIMSHGKA